MQKASQNPSFFFFFFSLFLFNTEQIQWHRFSYLDGLAGRNVPSKKQVAPGPQGLQKQVVIFIILCFAPDSAL